MNKINNLKHRIDTLNIYLRNANETIKMLSEQLKIKNKHIVELESIIIKQNGSF